MGRVSLRRLFDAVILLTELSIPQVPFLKAIQIHTPGGIDQLRYQDVDEPRLQTHHDVIVRLKAAAVNRIDVAVRSGVNGEIISSPRTLGADGAGTVFSAGAAVRNVKPGDAVCLYPIYGCGACRFCAAEQEWLCRQRRLLGERDNGTYAEFVRVPARNCFADAGRAIVRGGRRLSVGICYRVAHVDHAGRSQAG